MSANNGPFEVTADWSADARKDAYPKGWAASQRKTQPAHTVDEIVPEAELSRLERETEQPRACWRADDPTLTWEQIRAEVQRLTAAIDAVKRLHTISGEPEDWMDAEWAVACRPYCDWCTYDDRFVPWPCPTVAALSSDPVAGDDGWTTIWDRTSDISLPDAARAAGLNVGEGQCAACRHGRSEHNDAGCRHFDFVVGDPNWKWCTCKEVNGE